MAGTGNMSAAAAPCLAIFSLDVIYGRGNYIHEMSCGEVGPHLYSRMCCAGRCWCTEAPVFVIQANRRSLIEGGDNSVCVPPGRARVRARYIKGEGEGCCGVNLTFLCPVLCVLYCVFFGKV